MAFAINFYKLTGQKYATNKKPTLLGSVQGDFKDSDSQSYLRPVVRFQEPSDFKIENANYIQIVPFGRYYFIEDIKIVRTGIYELSLHEDVIFSHAGSITSNTTQVMAVGTNCSIVGNTMTTPFGVIPSDVGDVEVFPCTNQLKDEGSWILVLPGYNE